MTVDEKRADELRRASVENWGVPSTSLLPWEFLQDSERRRWLEQAEGDDEPR